MRGYAEFLASIADPKHERHDELRQWYAGMAHAYDYAAGEFDADRVDLDRINRRIARPPKLHRSEL